MPQRSPIPRSHALGLAPKGRQIIARGVSPWTPGTIQTEAPTGRKNAAIAPRCVAPLGLVLLLAPQGLTPQAIFCRPFGAEDDTHSPTPFTYRSNHAIISASV